MSRSEFLDGRVVLHGGDCRDVLRDMPDASVDSVVTDPPYALVSVVQRFANSPRSATTENMENPYGRTGRGFMGHKWDTGEAAFAVEFWAQVLRVLKPGGHVVAFSGTRTYHRLACAIEDAGFEIRDQLAWAYGSGFPKSHDVAKGIDKAAGARVHDGVGFNAAGIGKSNGGSKFRSDHPDYVRPAGATDAARQWQGWGTALKPAWEPIALARKPLVGTVAETVVQHGTGALNIDGCRVGTDTVGWGGGAAGGNTWTEGNCGLAKRGDARPVQGRWPANIIHDGSDEVLAAFPTSKDGVAGSRTGAGQIAAIGLRGYDDEWGGYGGEGSAARFFYSAKADKTDRMGSGHPTVKPVDVMQWLCRLVTPPGGVVLDPFAGSGSTGEAAWREGFRAILCEREVEYQADIAARLSLANAGPLQRKARSIKQAAELGGLFANDNAPAPIEPPTVAPAPCATIDVVAFADSFPRTRSTPEQIAERRAQRFSKRFNAQRSAVRALGDHAVEGVDYVSTKDGAEWIWAPVESSHAA